jgi:asparagine synthase (glutamine-hydrolysing)
MSILFGLLHSDGRSIDEGQLAAFGHATRCYATGETHVQLSGGIGMGFQPHHTHERSQLESGPVIGLHGHMIAFDGRLDNYAELSRLLDLRDKDASDSVIVLESFFKWGNVCFSRLIGDWALALWSPTDRTLYLARDHAGTRSLYYLNRDGDCLWSTYLETFFGAGESHVLASDYVARYIGCRPIEDLTPYRNIRSVPPAHYAVMRNGHVSIEPHWNWMIGTSLRYSSDTDYESHFLSLLNQSIERRTGFGAHVLAHLSGGMDSSSIVCVSDHLRRSGNLAAELVDTVSFYDDTEPNWDERPFFSLVEAKRGKVGTHISTAMLDRSFELPDPSPMPAVLPGADRSTILAENDFDRAIGSRGYRAILSGIGGDELLGGVPTPLPELADYLTEQYFRRLMERTLAWCLVDRTPFLHMLLRTARFAVSAYRRERFNPDQVPPWLARKSQLDFQERSQVAGMRGLSPTSITNGRTWWQILETLPHLTPSSGIRYEYRYPYLDRDLVEYLFQVPREQLIRPGERRSLMRRALKGVVPDEILQRRRKAYLIRGPLALIRHERKQIEALVANSLAAGFGFIDPAKFTTALDEITAGNSPQWWPSILRTIAIEIWLRRSTCYCST